MINWLIEASLRNRFLVVVVCLLIGIWGYWALVTTPIDAIPDLSDNQVIVFTDWPGRSPQEVEDQVTYPLTVSLQGLPGVRVVRASSAFGFSMINVIFEDDVDLYFARSRVLERLNLLAKSLPVGVIPTLGPDATGVGHVFWYTVEGPGRSLRDLRSIQDWYVRYQLNSVPGVAEVASVGGVVRQYQLIGELDEAATLPGVANIWTQPIINRINMLTTGIRSEVGVKVFGSDLKVLEERARAVADVLRTIPGAADVYPEQVTGAPYLDIRVRREAAARHGLTPGAIQDVIETAIGETNLTLTIEGRQRFPVRVRYAPAYRGSAGALGNLPVPTPGGAQVPLGEVADIRQVSGPAMIGSENGLLVVSVLLNVRGRDVGGFVEEARRALAERVTLPPGSYLEWTGQYENELRARQRLRVVVPVVLAIIFVLLYLTYHSALEAAHVLLAVPFALSGGIYLLYLLGYNVSVAVWVGFIALFGTAVQTAVVMVIYLEEAVGRKRQALGGRMTRAALLEAVTEGALLRLRPKVMTVSTIVASLLPIMWSDSTGAEVMKPVATPVLGGMVSSLAHVLLVTPVIFFWLRERELRHAEAAGEPRSYGSAAHAE